MERGHTHRKEVKTNIEMGYIQRKNIYRGRTYMEWKSRNIYKDGIYMEKGYVQRKDAQKMWEQKHIQRWDTYKKETYAKESRNKYRDGTHIKKGDIQSGNISSEGVEIYTEMGRIQKGDLHKIEIYME